MALMLLCVAQFVVVLDVTIVVVALPAIQDDLGFSADDLQWVVTSYTLVFGGLLILAGRAADLYGRRRLFRAGLLVFSLASLACGLAESPGALIAVRALQGLGAAMVAPAALSLLAATHPDGVARRRAVAWWTAAAAGGGASGWVLGGALTEAFGWETVFWVNVPIGVLGAVAARRMLQEGRDAAADRRLDVPGALTVTAGLALLVFGLTRVEQAGFTAIETVTALVSAAVLLGLFFAVERRSPRPLMPLGVLRSRRFTTANLVSLALTAATTPAMFLAVLHEQQILGFSPIESGFGCLPFNVAVIAGSLAGPRAVAQAGTRAAMAGGLAAVAVGAGLLAVTAPDGGYVNGLLAPFVLMGAGLGCAAQASTASGTSALGPDLQGLASGLLNATAQIGTVLGLAVLVTVAVAAGHPAGFSGAAAVAAAAAVVAAARRHPDTPSERSEARTSSGERPSRAASSSSPVRPAR